MSFSCDQLRLRPSQKIKPLSPLASAMATGLSRSAYRSSTQVKRSMQSMNVDA